VQKYILRKEIKKAVLVTSSLGGLKIKYTKCFFTFKKQKNAQTSIVWASVNLDF